MLESASLARLLTVDGWVVLIYQFGPPLLRAILVIVGTWIAARLARSSFNLAAGRTDAHARLLIGRAINMVIVGIGVATILDTVGVPLTTFVTVLGVAGLGVSLAMQDVLKSFVAGTFLLFERPFRIGDEISVKDQRGVVEHIGIRTTRLRNAENVQIIIPNGVVFAEVVANRTNEVKPEPVAPPPEVGTDGFDREGTVTDGPAPGVSVPAAPMAPRSALPPSMPSSMPPTGSPATPPVVSPPTR